MSGEARLVTLLPGGSGSPMSSYEVAAAMGVPQRSVGFMVSRLRKLGYPIGSVHGEGYYLIETREELEATIDHIERRKRGIDQTVDALRYGFTHKEVINAS